MVLGHTAAWPEWLALLSAGATATLLRAAALHLNWRLPAWQAGAAAHKDSKQPKP
jgi:hypothetical protein